MNHLLLEKTSPAKTSLADETVITIDRQANPYAIPREEIFWRPYPGPQSKYLACSALECLFGGAAGPGKSECMLMDAIRYNKYRWMRSVIFRRTYPELREMIDRSKQLLPFLGAKYNETKNRWTFPSGGILEFGNLPNKDACDNYQSRQFFFIGFEELTHWPTDYEWRYMISRLRSTQAPSWAVKKMRGTCNPGGRGHRWVKKYFRIDNIGTATDFWTEEDTRIAFIPARISDNPALAGTDYEKNLNRLPPMTRKALKEGRWDIVAGAMFGETWNPDVHVIDGFRIPPDWPRWRGADDGWAAPFACFWITRNPATTQFIVYQEHVVTKRHPEQLAPEIKAKDRNNNPNNEELDGIIDNGAFDDPGNGALSRGKQMNKLGCKWKPCTKGKGSRVQRVKLMHQLLSNICDEKGEEVLDENGNTIPGLVFFRNCEYAIETIPTLPVDPNNPEDVDTDAEDHGFDGLTYGFQRKSIGGNTSTELKGI